VLVLALATASLAAVPCARAAQSHLEAHCDSELIVDETSESGGVSGFPWADASASASQLALRAETNAASGGPDDRQCDVLTTFSNTVQIDPGSSGLSAGDPVVLEATVIVDGQLSSGISSGPPGPSDPPTDSYWSAASADTGFRITAPERPVCVTDDGREVCEPAELLRFYAGGYRDLRGYGPYPPDTFYRLSDNYIWSWFATGDLGDHDSHNQICSWESGCAVESPPFPPLLPDYRGTRTFLVDALVGDRLQLDGQLNIGAGANHGSAHASFGFGGGRGFRAALAPATGFEGLQLTYELAPAAADLPPSCDPVAKETDEDIPVADVLTCADESPATLTYSMVIGPAHGQATLYGDGHYTYAPAADFDGQDSFQVTATDAGGNTSARATITVTVLPVDDKPVCQPKDLQATVGVAAQLLADCSDVDGDTLTIAIADQGASGTATVDGQTIVYTPNDPGPDSFTYTASDGTLTSDPVTVNVDNEAPPASLTMTVQNGLVVFSRKGPADDRARFTGSFAVEGQTLSCGSDVTVSVNGALFAQTVPGSAFQSKNGGNLCVYERSADGAEGIQRLALNLRAKTFVVKLSDAAEISLLTNPVTLGLEIDGLVTDQTIQMRQARSRWTYSG